MPCRDGQPWDSQGRVCCSTALSEGLCFTLRVFVLPMSVVQCLVCVPGWNPSVDVPSWLWDQLCLGDAALLGHRELGMSWGSHPMLTHWHKSALFASEQLRD